MSAKARYQVNFVILDDASVGIKEKEKIRFEFLDIKGKPLWCEIKVFYQESLVKKKVSIGTWCFNFGEEKIRLGKCSKEKEIYEREGEKRRKEAIS